MLPGTGLKISSLHRGKEVLTYHTKRHMYMYINDIFYIIIARLNAKKFHTNEISDQLQQDEWLP